MTEYELFRSVRARLETVWHDAELRRAWLAKVQLGRDPELESSREAGGRC